jgi:uncharacterized protein
MAKYLILSCDGGGIRGYLSSLLLQRLNKDLGIFGYTINLYAGTSTGGLIALALASGKSIDDIVTLYATKGADIFNPLDIQLGCFLPQPELAPRDVTSDLSDLKELTQVLYDDIGDPSVRTVLEDFIPGNPQLSALKNNVMVTTFQLCDTATPPSWNSLVIDNFSGSPGASTYLYDAALSTAAAPVYFPPYYHPQFGWCSDGGLFANNPAPLAVGLAIESGQQLSDIALLSIGTGLTPASMEVTSDTRLCYGLKYWAWLEQSGPTPPFPILNALMDGSSISNDHLASTLLGGSQNGGGRYKRANPTLPYPVALDDYSPATLQMFQDVATKYFASDEWSSIEWWVKDNFLGEE